MNGREYLDLLKARYSVRSFSDVQLTDAELDVLLQAAQLSPTAKNSQPFRLCVVQSGEELAGTEDLCGAIGAGTGQDRRGDALPLRRAHGDNRRLRYQRVSEGARL